MRLRTPNKYRNRVTVVDGIRFASAREARRYGELKLLLAKEWITDLRLQVPYELAPSVTIGGKKTRPLRWIADFVYFNRVTGQRVVEDVKGFAKNPLYRTKRHLMKHVHGIEIQEV